ncbi:MAG TPA: DUF1566 domain-containing protein [Leptospiraceae bacterium]|nr:DUF1566 domain-containing protein [Leptospiraceae bacterium]HMY68493.1 DUF1566 domain-containing protein [Leptospiraceae bacterium]HNF14020.1 DUF1566 domain-containing protein [Leptospiraceae bacterium]HNF28034.1 DUF1566 domain-containing protein [Leptospiraceae bacterium]HNI98618.1 DUF1566 domain-containing protein [Leptospiraceae bacterium]
MNILMKFLFTAAVLTLVQCEYKPKKSTYGLREEDKAQIILGAINTVGIELTSYGTVKDPKTRLEWKRCSQGQTFRSATNDCQGTAGTVYNPLGNYNVNIPSVEGGTYGAFALNYCNYSSNDCNVPSIPQVLRKDPTNKAVSQAFSFCDADTTGGLTGWRVPGEPELTFLASLGRNSVNSVFPNTPEDSYWTSYSDFTDLYGRTAKSVSFKNVDYGTVTSVAKETKLYVRCVRSY